MHTVKLILFGILAIIALLLIVALFVNKTMSVEKEVVINKPLNEVFEFIKSLKNQNSYSKWGRLDPNMKVTYTGTDGTVGFISAWEGNKDVGQGEQEIKKIDEGKRVDFDLRFIKPFKSHADAYMITEVVDSSKTKVKWGFTSQMPYPFNAMKLFINMDEKVGEDFTIGLNNLKTMMEK